jgi:predicted ATPase
VRANLKTAHEFGDQLLNLAQQAEDSFLLVEAHRNLGATLFGLGEFIQAQAHLEKSKALYDSKNHRFHVSLFGQDPGVASLSYGSWILWLRGYPDQALERVYDALTLAQELSHPFSIAYATTWTAWVHQLRTEAKAVREQAEAATLLCSEQAFEQWGAWAMSLLGWGLAELGRKEEGISQIRKGLAKSQATGAELLRPYYLSLLAEAYGKAGLAKEALRVLDEAIDTINRNAERLHEAEIYRLKGELLLDVTETDYAKAEANFHQAIDIARRQSAKSLELRAVVSLCRLWQKRDRKEEARKMLADIYSWFTEGFDTPDLREAKTQLEELS